MRRRLWIHLVYQGQKIHPLSPDQAHLLQQAAKGERLEALYTVALSLGLRRGEILGLRWDDIDLERSTLRVNQALQRIGGKLRQEETNTPRSRRTVALHPAIVSSLIAHRARQLQERLLTPSEMAKERLAFTSLVGTPLDPCNMLRDFSRVLAKAGLPRIRFHDLRHSAASLLLAEGVIRGRSWSF